MEKRRTSININQDILKLCMVPRKRTNIVYGTNINFKLGNKYITHLMDSGLLQQVGRFYETTEKGYKALSDLDDIEQTIGLMNI